MHDATLKHLEPLCTWLVERVAMYLNRSPADIDPDVPLSDYGLDSVYALTLSGDIEDHLGVPVEPTLVWDYPTISSLAQALFSQPHS